MGDEEIRRRRTADPELDALVVMQQALEPLGLQERERVIKWAEDRFVRSPGRLLTAETIEATAAHFKAIDEYARQHGVTSREVMHTISAQRARAGLVPRDEGTAEVNLLPDDPLLIANRQLLEKLDG